MSDNIRLTASFDSSAAEVKIAALKRSIADLQRSLDGLGRSNLSGASGTPQVFEYINNQLREQTQLLRGLEGASAPVRSLGQQYSQLAGQIRSVQEQQRALASSAFDPFSRAQISGGVEELRRAESTLRGIQTLVGASVAPKVDFKSIIDGAVGSSQAISGAAASARAFMGAISLGAAAFIDDQQRQVRAAEAFALAKKKFDGETAASLKLGVRESAVALASYTVAQDRAARGAQDFAAKIATSVGLASAVGKYDAVRGTFEALHRELKDGEAIVGNWGQFWRHALAIVDGGLRGQRGQMLASFNALVRDSNISLAALAAPWGLVAVAGVGALTAIAYAAEQAYQRVQSLSDSAGTLALGGSGNQMAMLVSQFDRFQQVGNEFAGTVRKIQESAAHLPPTAIDVADSLDRQATAIAGLTGTDPAKVFDELSKAANKSPVALAEVFTELYKLQGVLDSSGLTLVQHARTLGNTSDAYRYVTNQAEKFRQGEVQVGALLRQNISTFDQLFLSVSKVFAPGAYQAFLEARGALIGLATSADRLSTADINLGITISETNGYLEKRKEILERLTVLQNAVRGVGGAEYIPPPETERALRDTQAQRRAGPLGPQEQEENRRNLENINARATARHADLQAQADAAHARVVEAERVAAIRVPGGDAGLDPAVQQARHAAVEADQKVADEQVRMAIAKNRAIIAQEQVGAAARIALQQKVISDLEGLERSGRGSPSETAAARVQLGTIIRQEQNRTFQEARDNARAEVELAKGNVDAINAAYAKLRGAAAATGQTPAVSAQIGREQIRDLESAQSQAFAKLSEFNTSAERQGQALVAARRAQLAVEVAQHGMSKAQMEAKEADFTAQVLAGDEKQIEAELKLDGLTEQQKVRLYDHLAELYTKDAQHQEQAQAKVTAALESENAKRLKSLNTMFDATGSAFEKLFEQAITRSATRQKAFQEFGQSIAKSILTEAGHVGSQLIGEKLLAPGLGVKTEGMADTGIGAILSKAIGSAFGLTKESTGQEALKGIADKYQKAADAHRKATDLFVGAVDNFSKAVSGLNESASKRGVASGYSGQAAKGDDAAIVPTGQAQAAVNHAMDYTGQKLKNYCAILVNESLEAAGVKGSGSGLASSFKSYGTSVAPGDVRKGDIFYSGPSGWGDTGHVGLTTGSVQNGQVPVISSHMQGAASNPAGPEWRNAASLAFRRPNYGEDVASSALKPSLDSLGAKVQSQTSLDQQSNALTQSLNTEIVADKQVTDQQKTAVNDNTVALKQATTKVSDTGKSVGAPVDAVAKSATSGLSLFTQGIGIASSAAALFGSHLSATARTILGAIGVLSQLSSFGSNLGGIFGLFGGAAKIFSLAGGGMIPSAAGGMAVGDGIGGQLIIAHPGERILTAGQTRAFHAMIRGVPSAAGGGIVGSLGFDPSKIQIPQTLGEVQMHMLNTGEGRSTPAANDTNATFNYTANVTGYHPYSSRSSFEGMLRQHGSTMQSWVDNSIRNGVFRSR